LTWNHGFKDVFSVTAYRRTVSAGKCTKLVVYELTTFRYLTVIRTPAERTR